MARPVLPITAPRGGAAPSSSSSPVDQWTKRLQEAQTLVDEVAERVAEREPSLPRELHRRTAEIRRKVAILGTRLDMLKEDLSDLPKRQIISLKQLDKLAEKLAGVTSKAQEVGGQFTMKYSSDRNDLCGSSEKGAKIDVNSIADMDNHEMVKLQRKVIKEQDAELDILEETVTSTKHIALAINGEMDLQTKLIENLDEGVEETSNKLQRALKRLKALNTRMRKSSSCWGIVLSVVAVVICVAIIWALITI
ncbi:syntaxin-52-like isoform X1 [Miscanthus floridulus]|uniref:syntaxin-52-like isoform X1 n=1 Tax=Miscanthus floridulus TaxID=154761 RepID=UPI0034574121